MDRFCSYCSSKIFESDRTCPQCGAPTMNYIVGLEKFVKSNKVKNEDRKNKNYDIKELESFFPYSDIRILNRGDSGVFNINQRDVFCILKSGRGDNTKEIRKMFQGQTSIIPELNSFSGKDVSSIFSTMISSLDTTQNSGLKISGFTSSEFVRLSQTISAWNGGSKVVVVGTPIALANVLPADSNYRYSLDSDYFKIKFLGNFYQTDVIVLPSFANYETPFHEKLNDDRIWMVSPTDGKLLKIVFEDETLDNVGIGLGISSTFATMVI